jgi:two-component system phosphate regulon sensor histidine kinase PhoR
MVNLLDNALKYTPEGGSVTVRAYEEDEDVMISVKDTGIGIPPKDIPRLFERFYRVDKGRSRQLGGFGLGLSIVKHIVHSFGGEIGVESTVNEGSTFWFRIPKYSK